MIILESSQEYKQAKAEHKRDICNGCGPHTPLGRLVPQTLWGLDISEACNIHDWDYHHAFDIAGKIAADIRFLGNMLALINGATGPVAAMLRMPRRRRALKYYEAVHRFGGAYFKPQDRKPRIQE